MKHAHRLEGRERPRVAARDEEREPVGKQIALLVDAAQPKLRSLSSAQAVASAHSPSSNAMVMPFARTKLPYVPRDADLLGRDHRLAHDGQRHPAESPQCMTASHRFT